MLQIVSWSHHVYAVQEICMSHLVFGQKCISDPLIIDLIESKGIQRLKNIDQHGISPYLHKNKYPLFSRFEHSIGVYFIVDKFSHDRMEKISALIHDVSHSPFSHALDYFFQYQDDNFSHQDSIHTLFLHATSISEILKSHGVSASAVDQKNKRFKVLEQTLPDLCADRIEYTLETAVRFNKISVEKAKEIYKDIDYKEKIWFFKNISSAKIFSYLALFFTQHLYSAPDTEFNNVILSEIIKRAIDINLIDRDDTYFASDHDILKKIKNSQDEKIQNFLQILNQDSSICMKVVENDQYDYLKTQKFRGVDPLVQTKENQQYIRLSTLSPKYKQRFLAVQKKMKNPIKFKNLCLENGTKNINI
jgi:uncharacterized protein